MKKCSRCESVRSSVGRSAARSSAMASASAGRAVIARSMACSGSGLRAACLPGGWRRTWHARGRAATAVLSEIRDDRIHRVKVSGVDQLSPLTALRKESCALKILKMESERRREEADTVSNAARVQPIGTPADEQAKDREAMFVSQGSEGGDDSVRLHEMYDTSRFIEVSTCAHSAGTQSALTRTPASRRGSFITSKTPATSLPIDTNRTCVSAPLSQPGSQTAGPRRAPSHCPR